MSLKVEFNGYDLSKYLDVTDLRRGVGTTRTNSLQKMGMANGAVYQGYTKDAKIYEMDFVLRYNLIDKRRKLAGILDVSEPSKLIFDDEPDKYVLAIPNGDINVNEIRFLGFGTISWIIPDGVSHAINEQTVIATTDTDGILKMQINNRGTEATELSFEATMTADNGFLGAVGPYGALEIGSIAEVDGHSYQKTDIVANNNLKPEDEKNWELNSPKAGTDYLIAISGIPNRFGEGSFKWNAGSEGPEPVFPNNPTACWVGPTLYKDIPSNSNGDNTKNFEAIWRCNFKTVSPREIIREEFNLMSGDKVVAWIVLRDSASTRQESVFDMLIKLPDGTKYKQSGKIDLKKATGSWYDVRISRIGSVVTFRLTQIKKLGSNSEVSQFNWQYQKQFTVPEFENIPITGTTYWPHAKWLNYPAPILNSKKESIVNFVFRWINVDKWSDDPNRYTTDDVIKYDGTTGKVYVNQLLAMNDIIQGSVDLKVPPGVSVFEFYYSEFGKTPPVIKGTFRERWL